MSVSTYHSIGTLLVFSALGALALAGIFLVSAIIGWGGPNRKLRLIGFAVCLLMFPVLVGAQQVLLYKVFLPAIEPVMKQQHQARMDAMSVVQLGDVAPAFKVTDTHGGEFDLEQQRGKVVILNFFATWCGPCRMELPQLEKLWNKHRASGKLAILVLGNGENNALVADFQSKLGFTLPMAGDGESLVYSRYARQGVPHTYLIDADGKICLSLTGFHEHEFAELEREVETRLAK